MPDYTEDPILTLLGFFDHVNNPGAEGYIATFSGKQARLAGQDGGKANEMVSTRQRFFRYPAQAEAAAEYLLGEAHAGGRDAFFGPALVATPRNRQACNVAPTVACLWLDLDEGVYPEDGPAPTYVVSSSANRKHLYWQLDREVPMEEAAALNRRLCLWAGGDTTQCGPTALLRPPGCLNFKRAPRVDEVTGRDTLTGPWSPEAMDQALPPLPLPTPPPQLRRVPYGGPEVAFDVAAVEKAGVEIRFKAGYEAGAAFSIACPWVEEHSGGDPSGTYVGKAEGGPFWFRCFHEHCAERHWAQFAREVGLPRMGGAASGGRRRGKKRVYSTSVGGVSVGY